MGASIATASQWLGVALTAAAAACAINALLARSSYATVASLAGAAALGAGALLAMANGDGALGLAIFGVALAPVLLMGGVLLSAQASKRTRLPLLTVVLALTALAPITWSIADLRHAPAAPPLSISGLWLAALLLVAACVCVGLLGYGERGVMQRRESEFE